MPLVKEEGEIDEEAWLEAARKLKVRPVSNKPAHRTSTAEPEAAPAPAPAPAQAQPKPKPAPVSDADTMEFFLPADEKSTPAPEKAAGDAEESPAPPDDPGGMPSWR